ncbi:type IV secretion system protein VirB7 (plasmid) [Shinella sp. WSC3-e]|nr:type IV secretion system protein VirB7 [Shinella sp. WSC3-e]
MIAPPRKNTRLAEMTKTTVLLVVLAALGGCASLTYPLPKCDGYSRRPLNRSMWEWEGDRKLQREDSSARSPTSATPYVEEDNTPAAFAHLDIDGSHRRCAG